MTRRLAPFLFVLCLALPGCGSGLTEAALILTAKEAAFASAEWACAQISKLRDEPVSEPETSGGEAEEPTETPAAPAEDHRRPGVPATESKS